MAKICVSRLPTGEVEIFRQAPNVLLNGVTIVVTWTEAARGWCPSLVGVSKVRSGCLHMYLRDGPACRRCHHLDWLCRHACRQTPGLFRVARWRRQIKADPHPFSALPEFPPQRIRIEESKLVDHLGSIVHDLDGRIRVRRAKADVMNQKRRDLILRRAERAIADENKCTLTARGFKT